MPSSLKPLVLLLLVATACGDGDDAMLDRPFADLTGVEAQFHPSGVTIADTVGIAQTQLPLAPAVRAFALSAVQQAGMRGVRADLRWDVVEPARGERDFTAYATDVDAVAGVGATTLPILCYGNPWANAMPGATMVPPDDPADFAAYAGAAAAMFRGTVPAYEVWNEPNLGYRFWQPREQPKEYGALLVAAAKAIRAADPGAKVVLGGLFYHGQLGTEATYFLERMYRETPKLASAYDVLALHPYKLYPPQVAPEVENEATEEDSLPRMVARMRAVIAYYGDNPARPIWATEVGWPTFGSVDQERQARWLVRSVMLLAGSGVERTFLYTLFDGPNPTAFPPEDAFGLFAYDDPSDGTFAPAPKLAWQALVTMHATVGSLAVSEDATGELVGAPPDAYAYRLTDPTGASARAVLVVWRVDDEAAPVDVTVPVAPVDVVDLLGEARPASASVSISGRPIYVVEHP